MHSTGFFNEIYDEISTDVLVIGAGGAGLRAAMEASDNGSNVLVVCKGKFTRTGSTFFPLVHGWGIQFLEEEKNGNTRDYFLKEILEVGEGMAQPDLVKVLIEQTPERVHDLEGMGIKFNKINGEFYDFLCCLAKIKRPVAAALDLENIQNTFKKEIEKRKVKVLENFNVVKIIVKEAGGKKKISGAIGIDKNGNLVLIKSKAVILACGGGSIIFKHNMNSPELTGDGYGLALDAGASLINMEYIQYIYGIVSPKRVIFSEKVFAYNPPILNINKKTFIEKYIPKNLSLSEIVKKRIEHGPFTSKLISKYYDLGICSEIRNGRGTENQAIYIDLKDLPKHINNIESQFHGAINWYKWIEKKGIDIQRQLIEIALCAHANNGGIDVDIDTASKVDGLFACGEIMGGPHGADRQGGNMMAATQVFGKIAGENASLYSKNKDSVKINADEVLSTVNESVKLSKTGNLTYGMIKKEIQDNVSRELVVCRREKGLKELIDKLEGELIEKTSLLKINRSSDINNYFTLKSLINTASVIANSALLRKESRGSHHREDYPEKNDKEFRKIVRVSREDDKNVYRFISSTS